MELGFRIDPSLDIPIYQQLVDKIRAAVKAGTLVTGAQLPTVQELSDRHISVTRRREMGDDIDGACGQLRRKHLGKGQYIEKDTDAQYNEPCAERESGKPRSGLPEKYSES